MNSENRKEFPFLLKIYNFDRCGEKNVPTQNCVVISGLPTTGRKF